MASHLQVCTPAITAPKGYLSCIRLGILCSGLHSNEPSEVPRLLLGHQMRTNPGRHVTPRYGAQEYLPISVPDLKGHRCLTRRAESFITISVTVARPSQPAGPRRAGCTTKTALLLDALSRLSMGLMTDKIRRLSNCKVWDIP